MTLLKLWAFVCCCCWLAVQSNGSNQVIPRWHDNQTTFDQYARRDHEELFTGSSSPILMNNRLAGSIKTAMIPNMNNSKLREHILHLLLCISIATLHSITIIILIILLLSCHSPPRHFFDRFLCAKPALVSYYNHIPLLSVINNHVIRFHKI